MVQPSTKRSYGTGSIVRAGPGLWRIHVRAGTDERGRPRRMSETVRAARKPERRLREILREIETGQFMPGQRDTVGGFYAAWWPSKEAALAPSGAIGLRRLFEKYLLPEIGDRNIQKVTSAEVARIVGALVERGRVGQAQHLFTATRMFFNAAVRAGLTARNPASGVERPARQHTEMVTLTPEQWRLIRNYLVERRSWAVLPFTVLVGTGIRRSELCGLRWQDFDPATASIAVVRSVHVLPRGRIEVRSPKTHRGRRRVDLDPQLCADLLDYRAQCQGWAIDQGRPWSESSYVFARHDGTPCRPHTLTQLWDRTVTKLGIRCRLHDLRHTAASLMLALGADAKFISVHLGHASAAFTMDVYAHLLPNRGAEVARSLGRLLNGPGGTPSKLPNEDSRQFVRQSREQAPNKIAVRN